MRNFQRLPVRGGSLMTRISEELPGADNLTICRNVRREIDGFTTREGDELFSPNADEDLINQPYPNSPDTDEKIDGLWNLRAPTGKTCILAATPTKLFRYYGFEDGAVYAEGVYEEGVFADASGEWLLIHSRPTLTGNISSFTQPAVDASVTVTVGTAGQARPGDRIFVEGAGWYEVASVPSAIQLELTNLGVEGSAAVGATVLAASFFYWFPPQIHRWECVTTSGYAVFNNGLDLLVAYRETWFEVVPLYELREAGIASVGTIGESNGVLLIGDLTEIREDSLDDVLNGADPYGPIVEPALINRVRYKIAGSGIGEPLRWAASVNGSITAGSDQLTLDWPMTSLANGESIVIAGAGTAGGNLTTTIQFVAPDGVTVNLVDVAVTTVADAVVRKSDASGLGVFSDDLHDDGGAILRILALKGQVVVLKSTANFLGEFTGDIDRPFNFIRVYSGPLTCFWRWTALVVHDEYILYAGRDEFLSWDLVTRVPERHTKLRLCSNLFFDYVEEEDQNDVWAAENSVTGEVWVRLPPATPDDTILAFDYKQNECSTLDRASITAAATVDRPLAGPVEGAVEQWFLMGTAFGTVLKYGLTATGTPIYTRVGDFTVEALVDDTGDPLEDDTGDDLIVTSDVEANEYTSTLRGGLVDFSNSLDETRIGGYQPFVSSRSATPPDLTVLLERFSNPTSTAATIGTATLSAAESSPLVRVHSRSHFARDTVSWSGALRLTGRAWFHKPTGTRAAARVPVVA